MNVKSIETALPGVLLFEGRAFKDDRGLFRELWNQEVYQALNLTVEFKQDNFSVSRKDVLRGLHYQNPNAQGKLVTVLEGLVYDVAVDIRVGSPTFGQSVGYELSAENCRQLYIPTGFAHGFIVRSDTAIVAYKCTELYYPAGDGGILWSDPDLGIDWGVSEPVLSPKDATFKRLGEMAAENLPQYS